MVDDPLFDAISEQRSLTASEVTRAIQWRLEQVHRLEGEIRVLRVLQDRLYLAADVRQERDPPIEASERSHH